MSAQRMFRIFVDPEMEFCISSNVGERGFEDLQINIPPVYDEVICMHVFVSPATQCEPGDPEAQWDWPGGDVPVQAP